MRDEELKATLRATVEASLPALADPRPAAMARAAHVAALLTAVAMPPGAADPLVDFSGRPRPRRAARAEHSRSRKAAAKRRNKRRAEKAARKKNRRR